MSGSLERILELECWTMGEDGTRRQDRSRVERICTKFEEKKRRSEVAVRKK
jgi:hypothetical protein